MKFYTGLLNHAGNSRQQIPLTGRLEKGKPIGVSAAEIILLGQIHGTASVRDLKEIRDETPFVHARERQYLMKKYAFKAEHREIMDRLFGPATAPLPEEAVLSTGASAFDLDALAAQEEAKLQQAEPEPVEEVAEPVKKARGRPKGSKNREPGAPRKRQLTPGKERAQPTPEAIAAAAMEAENGQGDATQPTG